MLPIKKNNLGIELTKQQRPCPKKINKVKIYMRKTILLSTISIALLLGISLVSAGYGYGQGSGNCEGDCNGIPDKIQDQQHLQDGSCQDTEDIATLETEEGEPDQIQQREGSCDEDCDGIPDQIRQRLKDGSCDEENEESMSILDEEETDEENPEEGEDDINDDLEDSEEEPEQTQSKVQHCYQYRHRNGKGYE